MLLDDGASTLPYFVIFPENRRFVSGATSFEAASHRKRRAGFGWLVLALLLLLGALLLFNRMPASIGCLTFWFGAVILIAIPLQNALTALYRARLYRQLSAGQWIDGEISSSRLYWASRGRGVAFFLEVTYTFVTPRGDHKRLTIKSIRPDLWDQVERQVEGIHFNERRPSYVEQMQQVAPPYGTSIRIRWVNDLLYRVM